MSLFDTSIKAGFSGTIILLRSNIAKKAKERKWIKKGLFFCLAAYISSRRWQKDFHRINREQEKVNRAQLWEILQTWKNPSCLLNFSALLFGVFYNHIQQFDIIGSLAQILANRVNYICKGFTSSPAKAAPYSGQKPLILLVNLHLKPQTRQTWSNPVIISPSRRFTV